MYKKTLLAIGDSHSSTMYGKSWPDYLADTWNMNLIRASSSGAGNSFYIEKLHYALRNYEIDHVVIQLTEPTRVVTGFAEYETRPLIAAELEDTNKIDDLGCYTWNIKDNESNIKTILNKNTKIDNVWIPQVGLSNWVNYKVMQDVIAMQYLCESFNKPCIFWSWFVSMEELFIEPYKWLKNNIDWIDGLSDQWLRENKIQTTENDPWHWGSSAHSRLVSEWLIPKIDNLTKMKNSQKVI
jgi:hypothetical protein